MVMLFVKFRSALPPATVRATMDARAPQFRAQPGLVQKYYGYERATGEWCGIYYWESPEALAAFRASELARTIPEAYQVVGAARVEELELLFPLRASPVGTGRVAASLPSVSPPAA